MVIGAERKSTSPVGWSADWSVAAGWSTTIASQVEGGDECSTANSGGSFSCTTEAMYRGWPSRICGTSS